ncbi:MAG: hypothetical protein ACKOGI_11270 [Vulcanococcus sp.]
MVQLTAEGHCTRRLALPAGAVQAALRRDRHAEHALIVLGDDGLVSLRTFSPSCTVAVDALDPLEAIDAEVQVSRLRALLPEDLELVEAVVNLGLKGAAHHRGEPIARVKASAERARARLRMVAYVDGLRKRHGVASVESENAVA